MQALAYTLESATQKEVAARLSAFADFAEKTRSNQGLLGGVREDAKNPALAFSSAFLSAVADVDGRQFVNFDPASNASHAALQWAYENGGPGHKVSAALSRIDDARLAADLEVAETTTCIKRLFVPT